VVEEDETRRVRTLLAVEHVLKQRAGEPGSPSQGLSESAVPCFLVVEASGRSVPPRQATGKESSMPLTDNYIFELDDTVTRKPVYLDRPPCRDQAAKHPASS